MTIHSHLASGSASHLHVDGNNSIKVEKVGGGVVELMRSWGCNDAYCLTCRVADSHFAVYVDKCSAVTSQNSPGELFLLRMAI